MSGRTILALDLALTTGWAIHEAGHRSVGTWDLRVGCSPSPGRTRSVEPAIEIRTRLCYQFAQLHIRKIVFEEAFAQPGASTWIQISLQTTVMLWCYDMGIPFSRHKSTAWKKALLGKGNANRDEYHRAAILKWPDLDIPTDDHAAALWLLEMELLTQDA